MVESDESQKQLSEPSQDPSLLECGFHLVMQLIGYESGKEGPEATLSRPWKVKLVPMQYSYLSPPPPQLPVFLLLWAVAMRISMTSKGYMDGRERNCIRDRLQGVLLHLHRGKAGPALQTGHCGERQRVWLLAPDPRLQSRL